MPNFRGVNTDERFEIIATTGEIWTYQREKVDAEWSLLLYSPEDKLVGWLIFQP